MNGDLLHYIHNNVNQNQLRSKSKLKLKLMFTSNLLRKGSLKLTLLRMYFLLLLGVDLNLSSPP